MEAIKQTSATVYVEKFFFMCFKVEIIKLLNLQSFKTPVVWVFYDILFTCEAPVFKDICCIQYNHF